MFPLLLLGGVVLYFATRKSSSTANSKTDAGDFSNVLDESKWTYLHDYTDGNGVRWAISEAPYASAYRGVAGPGTYQGQAYKLPTWSTLKTTIDAYAKAVKAGAK